MATVSLCMIVKNEESILERSLNSIAKLVDEIVIVDTGSTDKTVEIAKKFTDKVYYFKWIDNFSAARNYASEFCTKDYILRWDADFILREDSQKKFLRAKKENFKNGDVINFSWNLEFNERGLAIKTIPRHLFVYKREKFHWESPIHNRLVSNEGKKFKTIDYSSIEIDHYKDKNIKRLRYLQTNKILESELKLNPNNLRLVVNYAENLFFQKRYQDCIYQLAKVIGSNKESFLKLLALEKSAVCYLALGKNQLALDLLNKHFNVYQNHKRFKLVYADVVSQFDIEKAKQFYLVYLADPIKKTEVKGFLYDYERFLIHPANMLSQIYYKQTDYKNSIKYIQYVIRWTLLNSKKKRSILFLNKLKDEEN